MLHLVFPLDLVRTNVVLICFFHIEGLLDDLKLFVFRVGGIRFLRQTLVSYCRS